MTAHRAPAERLLPRPDGDFAVGDVVVYASYGIGRVAATRPVAGTLESITLAFADGLTVILPIARALEALRPPSTEADLGEVERTLRTEAPAAAGPWTQRHRLTRAKVQSGRVTELAEVVRDALQREQRRAAGGGSAAPSDRQLYLRARTLLSAEIAFCRDVEQAEADAWIVEQVTASS
jgi:RNA polymerase-interacting CarD/CdnL/TRCF family regulator